MTVEEATKVEPKKQETPAPQAEKKTATALTVKPQAGYLGIRPIEPSHLKIVKTYSSIGSPRPVVATGFNISSTMTISGNRPIMVSGLKISETYTVMGNRPVASNDIDDPALLMGYLD